METPKEESFTMTALAVSNFKRLRLVEIRPESSGITQIRGRNAQGKSSVLDAVAVLLGGKREAPIRPIRDGEEEAVIRGDFGNLVVRRTFTDPDDPTKSTLTVENEGGGRLPKPQEVLDRYMRQRTDPVAFMMKKPLEQVREALGLVEVPLDLEAHALLVEQAEAERRDLGREVKRLEGAVATLLPQVAGAPEKEVDTARLADDLAEGERTNAARAELEATAQKYAEQESAALGAVKQAEQSIERMKKELALAENARGAQVQEAQTIHRKRVAAETLAENAPVADLEPIRSQIQNARNLNRAFAVREQYLAECQRRDAAAAEHEASEGRVKALRQQRLDALSAVKWPHEGLGYDADGQMLTLHGVPFEQASGAQKLLASADIAMAQPGAIRILLVRDLNGLDREHLRLLDEHVRSRGFQMLGEKVDEDPSGPGVLIEDGSIANQPTK